MSNNAPDAVKCPKAMGFKWDYAIPALSCAFVYARVLPMLVGRY